jgi:DNA polymerase III gamma/tau subunit
MRRIIKFVSGNLLLAAVPLCLTAQVPEGDYERLKDALSLTDVQLSQCRRDVRYDPGKIDRILKESQRLKLRAIVERLSRSEAEWALARWLAMDDGVEWPARWCDDRMSTHEDQLGFSSSQKERLWELKQRARPEAIRVANEQLRQGWLEKSGSGATVPLGIATPKENLAMLLWELPPQKLPRDVAMSLLNDTQKARAAELENALELLREARSLGLVRPHTPDSGPLCN